MRRLAYFVTLADTQHFGRAAEALHISQPALSGEIMKLEKDLGVMLFIRRPHTALTAEGTALIGRARNLVEAADRFVAGATDLADGIAGSVTIGCVPSFFLRGLPQAVTDIEATWPGVVIHVREMNTADQIEALEVGGIDIACSHSPGQDRDLLRVRVANEEFRMCAPPGAQLRSLADARGAPFITFRREVSPHYWEKVMTICRAADVEPRVQHQATTWYAVMSLIRQGLGVSLVPALIAEQDPDLICADVDTGDVRSDSWVIMRGDDATSLIGQVYTELRERFGSV